MTTSTTLDLPGLEADNLLAFLALLGLLRALEAARPDWRPRVAWDGMPLVARLYLDPEVGAEDVVVATDTGLYALGKPYRFDKKDITFTADEFRSLAEKARNDRDHGRLIAALASDGALKRGDVVEVEPTPLCAMFGQGHQHFLTRLQKMATRCSDAKFSELSRALFEPWRYEDDSDGFRWDPIEDRRYALQFGDPSKPQNKIGTVCGANRLATIGFGAIASVPTASGLATCGVAGARRERDVCWPLVLVPTSLAGHVALLAHPWLGDERKTSALAAYGVAAVARARRFQVGKFFNFERARVQFL